MRSPSSAILAWTGGVVAVFIAGGLLGCGAKIVKSESMTGAASPVKPYDLTRPEEDTRRDTELGGTCELVMPNDRDVRTCESISLFIRNPVDHEERRAEFSGANFIFRGLTKRSYVLSAASSEYRLETDLKNEVSPGQTLKIRIRAKDK